MQVSGRQRLGALAGVLCRATRQQAQPCKLVVFMSSCDGVEFHHQLLQGAYKHAAGWPLLTCPIWKLHGNLPQVRPLVLSLFNSISRDYNPVYAPPALLSPVLAAA